jgi:hypothetical protein
LDDQKGIDFVKAIQKKKSQIFISPLNIEEIKLASKDRRIQLVNFINIFRDNIVFVRHPMEIELLEFAQAITGIKFNPQSIFEEDGEKIKKYNNFLDNPILETSEKEKKRIKYIRLINRYIQTITRIEPKGKFSLSDVKEYREEVFNLPFNVLKKKINNLNNNSYSHKEYSEEDIVNSLRFLIIDYLLKIRPNIKYLFDKETGPAMINVEWPDKDKDRYLARKIMSIDFQKSCPGAWTRSNVAAKQSFYKVKSSNWWDGGHSVYLPYVGFFLTSDDDLNNILKSIDISRLSYCGKILYFNQKK